MVTSKVALDIIEEVTGKRTDNSILKRWSDQGRINRIPVHARCALYEESEIREAAKSFGKQRPSLGKPVSISVQLPSTPCCVESNA